MKIISFRHGAKEDNDINGGLSQIGREQGRELGKGIGNASDNEKEQLVGVGSSVVARVEDTAKAMLEGILETNPHYLPHDIDGAFLQTISGFGNGSESNGFLKNTTYLRLTSIPEKINKEFHTRWKNLVAAYPKEDKNKLQDQVALGYMMGKFSLPPETVGKPLLEKCVRLLDIVSKQPERGETQDGKKKVITLATHQTINESLLVTLCQGFTNMPKQWQFPFGLAESIIYNFIQKEGEWGISVEFRGVQKRFSKSVCEKIIQNH